jgi:hypothetical protein
MMFNLPERPRNPPPRPAQKSQSQRHQQLISGSAASWIHALNTFDFGTPQETVVDFRRLFSQWSSGNDHSIPLGSYEGSDLWLLALGHIH